jgi:hypothetical protein
MSVYNYPFPTQPQYLAIWLSYQNQEHIADLVCPEVPVEAETFKYYKYNKEDFFRITETQVGRLGQPNQVEFGGTEETAFVVDHGLDAFVPQKDIDNAPPGYDPRAQHIYGITERVKLAREKRVADLFTTAGNYAASNRQTLSGSSQFSHADSDPFDLIMTAMDGMLVRPNIAILNRPSWTKLRRNPKLTAALASPANGNSSTTSANGAPASLQAVAELLELDRIYIGAAWNTTTKEGQTASYTRLWGNHMALLHQRPMASLRNGGITFAATAAYGPPVAGTMFDPRIGLRGAYQCRAGNSLRELVVANDAGYLLSNVIP